MSNRRVMGFALSTLIGAGLLFLAGCDPGHDSGTHKHCASEAPAPSEKSGPPAMTPPEPAAKAYPLKTCVVSGEALGSMGEPKRIVYEGQEIKFCCGGCEKEFRKDAPKFLKKIEEARKGP